MSRKLCTFSETLGIQSEPILDELQILTPVDYLDDEDIWLKRDDKFEIAGVNGGKARSCWQLSQGAVGLTTGSSRVSTQCLIVSKMAHHLGIPCRIHTALGALTKELLIAQEHGAEIQQWVNGFSGTLAAKARKDAAASGWTEIPFGMESMTAVQCTQPQVANLPKGMKRLVVSIGSGVSVCGILWGLLEHKINVPVVGVRVGGGKKGQTLKRRLDKYAPPSYNSMMEVVQASVPYDKHLDVTIGGVEVDPHYEAKVVEFLQPGDVFWIVGHRGV